MSPPDITSLPPNFLKEARMQPDYNDPSNAAVKPGHRTTEFYLSVAASLVGLLLILLPAILPPDEKTKTIMQVIGGIAAILGSLGYTVPRQMHKTAVAEGAAAVAIERIRAEAIKAVPTSPAAGP